MPLFDRKTFSKRVTVEAIDGGFIFEWDKPNDEPSDRTVAVPVWPERRSKPTRGREIITSEKALMKRLKGFLT